MINQEVAEAEAVAIAREHGWPEKRPGDWINLRLDGNIIDREGNCIGVIYWATLYDREGYARWSSDIQVTARAHLASTK